MRDRPSVGMVRVFNKAILQKMKKMGVERYTTYQIGLTGKKYYTKENRSAYIQRIDRTLSTDGSGALVRHFYYWKNGKGGLFKCETEAQLKRVIIKLDYVEREFFFIKYLLKDTCAELFSKIDFEDPEMLTSSIVQAVDDYLDARYRNYDKIASFTSENVVKWMMEDEKFYSSYNFIRSRMINELGVMVRESSQPLRF